MASSESGAASSTRASGPSTSRCRGVLVLGQSNRYILQIVRSLGRAGYHVVLDRGGGPGVAEKSRYTGEVWCHPSVLRGTALKDALMDFLRRRTDIGYVFPGTDLETTFLALFHEELSERAVLVMPNPSAVAVCVNKDQCLDLASEVGVPVAPYRVVRDFRSLRDAVESVGFPCIVKPCRTKYRVAGRKARIIDDEIALADHLPTWPQEHDALIVQRYVSGPRTNISFVARGGKVVAAQQDVAMRTDEIDGTGFTCWSITTSLDRALLDHTNRLARALAYDGVGLIQFIVDEASGQTTLLELNPRYGGSIVRPSLKLDDHPRLALEVAAGNLHDDGQTRFDFPAGHHMSSIHLDLSSLAAAYRRREIGYAGAIVWFFNALWAFVRADEDTIWSWRDPGPGLYGFTLPFRRRDRA